MRVISGRLKGKSIEFLKNLNTRPLKDSVKENIFNILMHSKSINVKLKEANILDLYSGIGSFGIEAISRGAKKVTFIEKNQLAINLLKKNLKKLKIFNEVEVFENNIHNVLSKKKLSQFDIIFFDPPFADDEYLKFMKLIKLKNFINKNHLIIVHREKNSKDELNNFMSILSIKIYGRSKVIFGNFS